MVNRVSGPMGPGAVARKPTTARGTFSLDKAAAPPAAPPIPPGSMAATVGRLVSDLEHQRREIDTVIRQAARGRSFSAAELLVLQSKVYTYSQQMEVVSRMVDKAVSTMKTTLNTQV